MPSIFDNNSHISQQKAKELLKNAKGRLYQKYNLTGEELNQLINDLTDHRNFGTMTSLNDIKKFENMKRKEVQSIQNATEKQTARRKAEKEIKALKDVFLGE